jgi:hypothetical protein
MRRTDPLWRDFIPEPHLRSFGTLFLNLTGGSGALTLFSMLLLLAYFGVSCPGLLWMLTSAIDRNRRRDTDGIWPYILVIAWLAVPILGSFAISLVRAPIFYPRNLIVALPALVTIAAIGIAGLCGRALQVVALLTVVALALPLLVSYYRTDFKEGEDWRRAVSYVVQGGRHGGAIVFLSRYGRRPFEYYLQRARSERVLRSVYPNFPWGTYTPVLADLTFESSTVSAAERLRAYHRVWVVLTWVDFSAATRIPVP